MITVSDEEILHVAGIVMTESARRWNCAPIWDEVRSDALLGIAKALARYNPDLGVPFIPYALQRARGEVLDGMRRRSAVPRYQFQAGIRDAADLLPQQRQPHSLDQLNDLGYHDQPDRSDPVCAVEASVLVSALLPHLTSQQRYCLTAYYLHDRKQDDIAAELHLTPARISQILRSAIEALRPLLQEAA